MSSMKRVKYGEEIERALDPQKKRRGVNGSADKMQNVGRIREVSSVTKFPPAQALPFSLFGV